MKKVVSMFLIFVFILSVPFSASASTASTAPSKTFEQVVNEMKLEPLRPSYRSKTFVQRIDNAGKDKKTNYDKLVAVFQNIVSNPVRDGRGNLVDSG